VLGSNAASLAKVRAEKFDVMDESLMFGELGKRGPYIAGRGGSCIQGRTRRALDGMW